MTGPSGSTPTPHKPISEWTPAEAEAAFSEYAARMDAAELLCDLVPAYSAGLVVGSEAAAFREHLEDCPGCQDVLELDKLVKAAVEGAGPGT